MLSIGINDFLRWYDCDLPAVFLIDTSQPSAVLRIRKEVWDLKYKVTKVYVVEASSKSEAIEKVVSDPDTLEMMFCSKVEDKSFIGQVKSQLTGK